MYRAAMMLIILYVLTGHGGPTINQCENPIICWSTEVGRYVAIFFWAISNEYLPWMDACMCTGPGPIFGQHARMKEKANMADCRQKLSSLGRFNPHETCYLAMAMGRDAGS
ncbi:hypothetical protein B0I35DRAFT_416411 [Stachybotrys elegans]|uniref:Secreted protein n=1 Tax=Stachybotrys elegans TaxID=80388 RepID=A0A8K0T6L1_9HYPO|nr:hypothetical protein B0I35DRAFT_416411 [Stachybotrys elegans]